MGLLFAGAALAIVCIFIGYALGAASLPKTKSNE